MWNRISSRSIAAALSACVLTAGLPVAAADWPQFRGPHRDGISRETGLLASWPEAGPQVLWRTELGEGYSGIAASGGRLFTMFGHGKDEFVVCLDAAEGKELWRHRTGSKWEDRFGNGPRSTPTLDGTTVYALGARGRLVALSVDDGKQIWARDLQKDFGAKPPRWGVATSPLVDGGRLLVDVGGREGAAIVAFDKADGSELWRSQDGSAGYSAPIAVTVGGLRQVLFFTARDIVSLSPEDGALNWKLAWKTSYDVNAAAPVFVAPDRVFFSSGYDKGSVMLRLGVREGRATVEELWRSREMKNKFSSSVLHGTHLYGFDEATFKCVDTRTGETVWRHRGLGHGSLIYADGHLIVLSDDGQLLLVEATAEAYREKAGFRVFNGKTWTSPALVDGRLYLRDEKELISLDISG